MSLLQKDLALKKNMRLLSAAVLLSSLFTHGAFENPYESVKDSHSHASLEVQPDNQQHLSGGNFTLRCSVNGGNSTTGWILRKHQGAKNMSGCLQLNGIESIDKPEECHFIDIDSKKSGLYWCENAAENKTSNGIHITVVYGKSDSSTVHPVMKDNSTADSEDEQPYAGSLVWVSGLCIVLVLLVLLPVLWLLCPSFREKLRVCPNGAFGRERVQQEMPKTKQDGIEIQWDLPWMEMDNLLDK